jgi:hypothetical protein
VRIAGEFRLMWLQVEAAPNSAPMLAVARNLRVERDREEQIQKQKHEQRSSVSIALDFLFVLGVTSAKTSSCNSSLMHINTCSSHVTGVVYCSGLGLLMLIKHVFR